MLRCDTRLIKTLLFAYGFTEVSARNPSFNILWTSVHLRPHCLRSLAPWQRVNHFPRSGELTRKDRLYENIGRSKALFGQAFDFIPDFFVTPRDLDALEKAIEEGSRRFPATRAVTYIVKPVSSSRGRGIFLATRADEIPLASPLLVSRYISHPLLVNGHKFDLRVYVAVTSFHPLVAYMYTEGLARFASEKYAKSGKIEDEFVHLTNYSLNKNNRLFVRNETLSTEDFGHKWTLGAVLRHLEEKGVDVKMLMLRIEDVVVKCLLSVQSSISSSCRALLPHPSSCFELFGFDILVDEAAKPWLLEVNLSPSLTCDAPLDSLLKTRLVCHLFNLACIPAVSSKSAAMAAHLESVAETDSDRASKGSSAASRMRKPLLPRRVLGIRQSTAASPRLGCPSSAFVKKVRLEERRRGGFLRLFPRQHSLPIYSKLMEFVGAERHDERLYNELFPVSQEEEETEEGVFTSLHSEMMNSKKFPAFATLSPEVQILLADAYGSTAEYMEMITKEGQVYPARLPSVRRSARQRTRSCADWHDLQDAKRAEEMSALLLPPSAIVAPVGGKENQQSSSPSRIFPSLGDNLQKMTSVLV